MGQKFVGLIWRVWQLGQKLVEMYRDQKNLQWIERTYPTTCVCAAKFFHSFPGPSGQFGLLKWDLGKDICELDNSYVKILAQLQELGLNTKIGADRQGMFIDSLWFPGGEVKGLCLAIAEEHVNMQTDEERKPEGSEHINLRMAVWCISRSGRTHPYSETRREKSQRVIQTRPACQPRHHQSEPAGLISKRDREKKPPSAVTSLIKILKKSMLSRPDKCWNNIKNYVYERLWPKYQQISFEMCILMLVWD